MGVIAEMANNVIVMYAGKIMEQAPVNELFENPHHPYTESLLNSIPKLGQSEQKKLHAIPGIVPSLLDLPGGCKFNDRCNQAFSRCNEQEPPLFGATSGHTCRCWLYEEMNRMRT
jgi:peptide/nickel transport system ATP-binding protein/oligopeptide transport system ATP-binding protein